MQLPDISDTAASNVVRLADTARKTRVLYAGDMEFAKAQFASVAPQLHLIPAATILGRGGDAAPASNESPDAALIDCGAAGVDARSIVEGIRARGLDLPIVLALDPGGAEDAPTKLTAELRVDDYTVKLPGWLARLNSRLEFAIAHHRRRRSLDALQASSERLRTVVESAPVCLARVTRDGTILAMNAAAMKMVDADTSEDVLGKSLLSFVDSGGADDVRRFLDAVSAGQAGSLEFATTAIAGSTRVVDTRAVPLSPDTEGRASALLVLRDATERKRLEESMLAHAAAAAATSSGAATVDSEGHDNLRRQLDAALEECRRIEAERDALAREADEARARAAMIEHVRAACTAAEQQLHAIQVDYQRAAAEVDTEREKHREVQQSSEAERTGLVARCEALEALVASMESRQAAEREEHGKIRADLEAALRERDHGEALATEREALQASLGSLRSQFDEMTAALDAADARHTAAMHDHRATTAAIEAQLHEAEQTRTALAAERDQLRGALEAADARHRDLQAIVDEARAGREAEIAEAENARRALSHRIDELQARADAAVAEREAIAQQLRREADAASARADQSQATLEELRAARDAHAAEAQAAHARAAQLQAAIDDLRAARDTHAEKADTATAQTEQLHTRIAELRAALDAQAAQAAAATARAEQLAAAVEELRAARDSQAVEGEAARHALAQRVDELQGRVNVALAERDALGAELQRAVEAAAAQRDDLRATLDDVRGSRQSEAAAAEALRRSLAERVDELQTRLDAVIIDREALERAIGDARAGQAAQLNEALAARESLQHRLAERDAEYDRLRAEHAALKDIRQREAAEAAATAHQVRASADALAKAEAAQAAAKTAAAEASARALAAEASAKAALAKAAAADAIAQTPPAALMPADLRDAQVAFREAFQLLSGELQTAMETTRAHQAALLRHQPLSYDALEEQLRHAESEARRLEAERDDRDATVRALQAEIELHIELRRQQRKELVRALQESDANERRAVARVAECDRMRQMLTDAQSALQRLSKWASTQSTRLAAPPVPSPRALPRVEAPAPGSARQDDQPPAPPLEASWS